mmetsp:Transcript_14927/g.16589  ORF Transcript_14927/g.16589 Transcript_14927/m.16589 type:complete len:138 (-) Transcript_14927:48-461(-)
MGSQLSSEHDAIAKKYFNDIDKDGSGEISLRELRGVLRLPKAELKKIIIEVDDDKNRKLNYEQFLQVFEKRFKGLFQDMDTDASGNVDNQEFVKYVEGLGFADKDAIAAYLKKVDANGDGKISFMEFTFGLLEIGVF